MLYSVVASDSGMVPLVNKYTPVESELIEYEGVMGYLGHIGHASVWIPAEPYNPLTDPNLIWDEQAGVYVMLNGHPERFLSRIVYQPLVA